MRRICSLFWLSLLVLLPLVGTAKTDWEKNRLIPLEKLTVGPWDNFEATVAADDNLIYYTRDRNGIPNVLQQNLQSNTTRVLIGAKGDAKEPALDPGESRLAVTYFGNDAQGDVCIYSLPDGPMNCLTSADSVDKSPFWIDNDTLGYLSRATQEVEWKLTLHDLKTGDIQVIHRGLISTPQATSDGRYILLSQAQADGDTVLQAWDRKENKLITPPRFDLPGISGSAITSSDDHYLYFNQYLNDTNGDQIIDGNDHSVAFRIAFSQWLHSQQPLLPEQLTSVEKNCKFPARTSRYLYLTCAFEGSLDIYRLPLTGSVPTDWTIAQLWEAHRIARSYEDRLLILNTLRYRYQQNNIDMLERLLSNHLEIGELTAARYYVAQLQQRYQQAHNPAAAHFYQALDELFLVRSSKQRVPVGIVTARFKRLVEKTRKKLHEQPYRPDLITLMDAWFDYELEDEAQALARMQQYDLAKSGLLPLERMLAFDLLRRLLEQKNPEALLARYPSMFNATDLPLDARIYYAFNYLKLLDRTEKDTAQRLHSVESQLPAIKHPKIIALFQGEIAALKLVLSKGQETRNQNFQSLSKLLKEDGDDPLLRKAMHVRAIQNLGEADQFQYMELLSRNWLLTTKITEMEFVNVAEQFAVITMDKAYGMLAQGQRRKAYSTFYSAIRQTNDLEAHYQFLKLGLLPDLDLRDNLIRSYEILEKQGLLGQNRAYVEAWKLLLETNREDEHAWAGALKKALALLEPMRAHGLNPAMRDLLMGYIYHQQLRASQSGYRYDKALFQKAHYHYIMALDLGRDNSRITTSVWENLAVLHFEVRNYALSVDFFTRRMQLPFVSPESEALTRLRFARALFSNNQPDLAHRQAQKALELAQRSKDLDPKPFLEKHAFYALQANDYATAIKAWESLLAQPQALTGANRAKALLGYGYALMKAGYIERARKQLKDLLELSKTLKSEPASQTRLIPFRPERFQLLAWGLLAEIASTPEQKIEYRQERVRLLQDLASKSREFAWKEATRLSLLAKDYQQIAVIQEALGQYPAMAESIAAALKVAAAWTKESGDQLGPVIYRTLTNYLVLGLSHPNAFGREYSSLAQRHYQQMITAFQQLKWRPVSDIARETKLKLLWQAYRSRVMENNASDLADKLEAIVDTEEVGTLKKEASQLWDEVLQIKNALSLPG